MASARQRRIDEIHALSVRAFRDHVLMVPDAFKSEGVESPLRMWKCGKPDGSSEYAFWVIVAPFVIYIRGDLGTMAWERTERMIPWARGAVDSIDYLCEKVPRELHTKEYDPELAKEYIADRIRELRRDARGGGEDAEEAKEQIAKWRDIAAMIDEHDYVELVRAMVDEQLIEGVDAPPLKNFTNAFLWLREALKWFLEHLPEDQS